MRLAIPALIFGSLLGACTSNSADDTEQVNCATETRADTFIIGLEKPGDAGMLDFALMSADPAPPASGDNAWEVQVKAMTNGVVGDGVAGATIKTTPYMPDHMHTSPIKAIVTDEGGGMYKIEKINLWMPGLWQTTFQVASPAGTDSVVYSFCIPN